QQQQQQFSNGYDVYGNDVHPTVFDNDLHHPQQQHQQEYQQEYQQQYQHQHAASSMSRSRLGFDQHLPDTMYRNGEEDAVAAAATGYYDDSALVIPNSGAGGYRPNGWHDQMDMHQPYDNSGGYLNPNGLWVANPEGSGYPQHHDHHQYYYEDPLSISQADVVPRSSEGIMMDPLTPPSANRPVITSAQSKLSRNMDGLPTPPPPLATVSSSPSNVVDKDNIDSRKTDRYSNPQALLPLPPNFVPSTPVMTTTTSLPKSVGQVQDQEREQQQQQLHYQQQEQEQEQLRSGDLFAQENNNNNNVYYSSNNTNNVAGRTPPRSRTQSPVGGSSSSSPPASPSSRSRRELQSFELARQASISLASLNNPTSSRRSGEGAAARTYADDFVSYNNNNDDITGGAPGPLNMNMNKKSLRSHRREGWN
ncbi:hypothetical protein BGZ94_001922, partial [Podila epigama]